MLKAALHAMDVVASVGASTARSWRGTVTRPLERQPEKPLEIYEFEACPFCRLLREHLTELDLDPIIYPCPKGGERFRPTAIEIGGKTQFPLLVDPNTDTVMYESADIARYLAESYGGRLRSDGWFGRPGAILGSQIASVSRRLRGMNARPSRAPDAPLELFSFESSPFSRIVRELLCELELPYRLRTMGKSVRADMGPPWIRTTFYGDTPVKGRNRVAMMERTGRLQVPYLIDPNTDTEMYESAEIVRYLENTYGDPA